ncbi:MAG TPA: class I SAM-dependent methyltransferase [Bryobacteraceae bacterium]|nr:class I SAM-dependent methyltransferase [Bryobacteraceae bacterium]
MLTAVQTGNPAGVSPYRFKPGPYSSHTLLLASLPARGEGRRVLDIGCAAGYLGAALANRGYRVTGIENPAHVPADFPPGAALVCADLDQGLPPQLGAFDFILCADVLEHLRRPEALLRELRRALAPGGRLIASLPNSGHLYFRWNVLLGRFPQHDRGLFDRTHLHFYTWQGWRDLFAGAGFAIESLRCSAVPVGEALPAWKDRWPMRAAERLSYWSARCWKTACAYQFIVVARPVEAA